MKTVEKAEARRLRKEEGLSYKDIAKRLRVGKSSISHWCRDIELTNDQLNSLAEKCRTASILSGLGNKKRWDGLKKELLDSYDPPLDNPRFMLGLGLYWGEGQKCSDCTTSISNCDADLLRSFIAWIKEFFPECKKISAAVHHYQPVRDHEIKSYWADKLNLPLVVFNKSCIAVSRASKLKRVVCQKYGTVHLTCRGKGVWHVRQKIKKALEVLMLRSTSGEVITLSP